MSFTTRCPACGTTFRIVPDQLKISDGWVRCGHCADVFDATLFLEGEASPPPPIPEPVPPPVSEPVAQSVAAPVPPPPEPVVERATPVEVADPAPVNAAGPVEAPPSTEPEGLVLPIAPEGIDDDGWLLPPPVAAPTVATDDSFVEELRSFAQSLQTPAHTAPSEPPSPDEVAKAPAVEAPKAAETVSATNKASIGKDSATVDSEPSDRVISDEELLPAEPSFVRQAKRRAFWRSRGVRIGLNLVSLVLGLGLLAQVAVHQRDALAARFPTLMPVLAGLCQPLACELGPARQIESVVIDSSTLVRRLGSFYSFDLVLRNSARIPVAMPALELSLTDTRDAVIARRVFLPDELPGEHQLLPASGNLSLSLRLYIAEQGVSSMSGYRALVFYP